LTISCAREFLKLVECALLGSGWCQAKLNRNSLQQGSVAGLVRVIQDSDREAATRPNRSRSLLIGWWFVPVPTSPYTTARPLLLRMAYSHLAMLSAWFGCQVEKNFGSGEVVKGFSCNLKYPRYISWCLWSDWMTRFL